MNRREMLRHLLAGVVALPSTSGAARVLGHLRSASVAGPIGVVAHELDAGSISLLRSLNISRVRTTLYWSQWETDPAYRLAYVRSVNRASDAGIELLIVVHQPPDPSYQQRRRTRATFAQFMAARVAQFPSVGAWQLFNEADVGFAGLDTFGAHSGFPLRAQGVEYARMLRIVAPAMREVDAAVRIIANPCATDGTQWAGGVIAGGGREHIDAWALNCYGFPVLLALRNKVEAFRRTVPKDPLWITEFGMESAVIAPGWPRSRSDVDRYHLEAWRDTAEWNAGRGEAERMYGYVLRGHSDFGLVADDGRLRPAAEWIRLYNSRF